MICLVASTVIISLYVLMESFLALCRLPGGFVHFCCKVKYLLAFTSSLAFIYYALTWHDLAMQWLLFGSAGTLAWFVWPRTIYRLKEYLRELDEWETGEG